MKDEPGFIAFFLSGDGMIGKQMRINKRSSPGTPCLVKNIIPGIYHRLDMKSKYLSYSEGRNKLVIARSEATRQSLEIASLRSQLPLFIMSIYLSRSL